MKEVIKRILLTLVVAIPVILTILVSACNLVLTGLRQLACWATGEQSYWDLDNEWFQVKSDLERWYTLWKHGRQSSQ